MGFFQSSVDRGDEVLFIKELCWPPSGRALGKSECTTLTDMVLSDDHKLASASACLLSSLFMCLSFRVLD